MDRHTRIEFALARSNGLLVEEIDAETVIFDSESKEAHCLSPLAAAVFAAADGRTRDEGLAAAASSRLGEPVDAAQVQSALAQLDERGLLVGPQPAGMNRRTMMRRTAVATAAVSATPLVTSIVTPAFGQAQTGGVDCPRSMCAADSDGDDFCACNNGCPCGTNAPCDQGAIDKCNKTKTFTNGAAGPPTAPNSTPPYLDSCECLKCPGHPQSSDQGDFSGQTALADQLCAPLYGANYRTNPTRPSCADFDPGVGGCNDNSKTLNGVCVRLAVLSGGDSSEPCPT